MPEETLQERTEEATPRRREEARKRGQVAKSRELNSVAVLFAGTSSLLLLGSLFLSQINLMFGYSFTSFNLSIDLPSTLYLFKFFLLSLMKFLLPLFVLLTLSVLIVYLLQTGGGVWAVEAISLKFERLNPIEGFRRLFSLTSLFELVKSLLKLAIIILVSYFIIKDEIRGILNLLGMSVGYLTASMVHLTKVLIIKILFILFLLSLLDWLYNWWEVERKLRMTREELKEELKQTEGDPLVRARIRQKQRELARRRMLAEVPKADVVITNPEHFAVALKYEMGEMPAPQVVAKGVDYLAQKIKEIAQENDVPIFEDPPLARLLYYKTKVGDYIPQELYEAVAKILAVVYKLREKRRGF
ncbi:MAG: flagellar biosynthesis protein FlhB [Thermodesulfobacteriaceae bacterium]|jgi:flagellar biosynthetic protein FlhB